jgi:DNA-binding protein HU-beta
MTKAEIVKSIAYQTGMNPKEVAIVVEAFMEEVRMSLANNKENVYLRGFGSFIVKHRAQKTARNISKNTTLVIEEHDLPAFKPCKSFIDRMAQNPYPAASEAIDEAEMED